MSSNTEADFIVVGGGSARTVVAARPSEDPECSVLLLEYTILLKTEQMRGVSVDPARRTARAEAGTVWLEVVEAAAQHCLAALAPADDNPASRSADLEKTLFPRRQL